MMNVSVFFLFFTVYSFQQEFARFEFYGCSCLDPYRSAGLWITRHPATLRSGNQRPEANKDYFFILGHFFSHDLYIRFQDFFAFCLFNPDFSAKATMSSALFIGIFFMINDSAKLMKRPIIIQDFSNYFFYFT